MHGILSFATLQILLNINSGALNVVLYPVLEYRERQVRTMLQGRKTAHWKMMALT